VKDLAANGLLLPVLGLVLLIQAFGSQTDSSETVAVASVRSWTAQRLAEIEQGHLRIIRDLEKSAETSFQLGIALNNLGLLYFETARYSAAEPLFRRAIPILEKVKGRDHLSTARTLSNLAKVYRKQGKYLESKKLLERVVLIRRQELGALHPDLARSLDTLAAVSSDLRQFDRAERLSREALAIWEVVGTDQVEAAACLNNLAQLLARSKRYGEAKTLHLRALSTKEKRLGPDHPQVAQSLNNLAALCRAMGDPVQARAFCRRGLEIREKSMGPDHPDVAESLTEMAALDFSQGRYDNTRELLQRSLKVREKALGAEHPDVARSLLNYAALLRKTNEKTEAKRLEVRARHILSAFPSMRWGDLTIDLKEFQKAE
jgi:tetratricopeptide (TPR) repeat protein